MKTLSPRSMFDNIYEALRGPLHTAMSEAVSDFVGGQVGIGVVWEVSTIHEDIYWVSLWDAQKDSCHHNLDQFIKNVHTTWGTR